MPLPLVKYIGSDADPRCFEYPIVSGDSLNYSSPDGERKYLVGNIGRWARDQVGAVSADIQLSGPGGIQHAFLRRESPFRPPIIVDKSDRPLFPISGELEVVRYVSSNINYRPPHVMRELLDESRERAQTLDVQSESGERIGTVSWDPYTGHILAINPVRCTNESGKAEKPEEHVCCTDHLGNIEKRSMTRAEARAAGERYLVCTCLVTHGDDVLLQKRSSLKPIDPGQLSSSAHGVAQQIFTPEGEQILDKQWVGFVNVAREMCEELRNNAAPFQFVVWPGTHLELMRYTETYGIDDPNTVYLVQSTEYADHGYPLHHFGTKRTRFVCFGVIHSKSRPSISVDPGELEGAEWRRPREIANLPNVSADVSRCLEELVWFILSNPGKRALRFSDAWKHRMLAQLLGDPDVPSRERTD